MIPAGSGRHRDHFSLPDLARATCTSSRVTWGGGECLDDSGELVRSCPRHTPAMYATLDARHRAETLADVVLSVQSIWSVADLITGRIRRRV